MLALLNLMNKGVVFFTTLVVSVYWEYTSSNAPFHGQHFVDKSRLVYFHSDLRAQHEADIRTPTELIWPRSIRSTGLSLRTWSGGMTDRVQCAGVVSRWDDDQLQPDEPELPQINVLVPPDLQPNTATLWVQLGHVVNIDVESFDDAWRQTMVDVNPWSVAWCTHERRSQFHIVSVQFALALVAKRDVFPCQTPPHKYSMAPIVRMD